MNSIDVFFLIAGDFLQYFGIAGLVYLVFWKVMRERYRARFIQRNHPKLFHIKREIKYSIISLFISKIFVILTLIGKASYGLTLIYDNISDYGWVYYLFSYIIMLIIHDTYFYWAHRLMHHPKIYRTVHLVHHKSVNPSPWAAYAFHPYESLIMSFITPLMAFIVPLHISCFIIFFLASLIKNVYGHCGYELFPKGFIKNKWLNWITTSTHHNMHHKYFNGNYGFYITFWDKIMNTEFKNYEAEYSKVYENNVQQHEDTRH